MKEENLVYVKLEYEEALESKRDILASQASLLRIIQAMRHYRLLRLEELRVKAQVYRKIKELITSINKIKENLPQIKIPSIKKKDEEKEFVKKIKDKQEIDYDDSLDSQLREIQERLRSIGG
jgi:hypothetical protein